MSCRKFAETRGSYSRPLADYHTGLLVTQFISLWLFWDDAQVEEEFGWTVDSVVAALTGPTTNPPSRYVAAWADLGGRLRATQSQRWLARLGATMRQWLDNARAETAMAKAYRDRGAVPEVAALFDCRTISIGMFPTFHLIEYAEGFELPDELHAHVAIVELKRLASRLVGMGNDLGGLAKDIRSRWLNLVLVEAERSSLSITDAFERIVASTTTTSARSINSPGNSPAGCPGSTATPALCFAAGSRRCATTCTVLRSGNRPRSATRKTRRSRVRMR